MVDEGTATFTFSGVGGGQTLAGSGAMRFEGDQFDADVHLTMPETGRVRAVLLPSASYLALPATKGLPRDKPWMKVSSDPRTRLGRTLRPVVDQLRGSFDPAQSLGLLRAARRVVEVGPATVEDVPTTHHHAVIDLRRATDQVTGPAQEQFQSMLDAGVTQLEYDVWLDTTGLPRRFTTDIPTTSGLFSVTGVYRDWGDERPHRAAQAEAGLRRRQAQGLSPRRCVPGWPDLARPRTQPYAGRATDRRSPTCPAHAWRAGRRSRVSGRPAQVHVRTTGRPPRRPRRPAAPRAGASCVPGVVPAARQSVERKEAGHLWRGLTRRPQSPS